MEIVYRYDGSFEGFLCCVFDSYVNKERPSDFQDAEHLEQTLFPARWVGTDPRHARRVLDSLWKIDPWAKELVVKGFLTCAPDREMILYQFIRALYNIGKPLLRQLSDDAVLPLLKETALRREYEMEDAGRGDPAQKPGASPAAPPLLRPVLQ